MTGEMEANHFKAFLYENYYETLMAMARHYFQDIMDAEDLVQDACLKLCGQIDAGIFCWKGEGAFIGWASRLIRHLALAKLRSDRLHEDADKTNLPAPEDACFSEPIITVEKIISASSCLPEKQRLCFLLYYLKGYSYKMVAEHLGISLSTALGNGRLAADKFKALIRNGL